jgi:hypothetical protein
LALSWSSLHQDRQRLQRGHWATARGAPPDLQWFWAITGIFGTTPDMRMDGHAPTLESTKAQLGENWRKWLAWAKLTEIES